MQNYTCDVNVGSTRDENGKRFKTYGISIKIDGKCYDYLDLTTDKKRIISLAEKVEREKPELKTLYEIFDDFIFEK